MTFLGVEKTWWFRLIYDFSYPIEVIEPEIFISFNTLPTPTPFPLPTFLGEIGKNPNLVSGH